MKVKFKTILHENRKLKNKIGDHAHLKTWFQKFLFKGCLKTEIDKIGLSLPVSVRRPTMNEENMVTH